MGQIKIIMTESSTEEDLNNAVMAASAALPDGMAAEPAQQIRDANGKLIEVIIGMPSNATAEDRTAARNAVVSGNPGVATAVSFPIVLDNDFDTLLTSNVDVPASLSIDDSILSIVNSQPTLSKWQGATAAQSVGGIGSALRLTDISTVPATDHFLSGIVKFTGGLNNLTRLRAWELEFDMRLDNAGDIGLQDRSTIDFPGAFIDIKFNAALSSNWFMRVDPAIPRVDTGIPARSANFIHVKAVSTKAGLVTVNFGTFVISKNFGFPRLSTELGIRVTKFDRFTGTVNKTISPFFIDNYKLTILDGTV